MHLDGRARGGPRVVVHAGRCNGVTARLQRLAVRGVERVTHTDAERAGEYRDVLVGRVPVGRNLVARRHLETHGHEALGGRIPIDHGELRARWQRRRRRSPFDRGSAGECVVLVARIRDCQAREREQRERERPDHFASHGCFPPELLSVFDQWGLPYTRPLRRLRGP